MQLKYATLIVFCSLLHGALDAQVQIPIFPTLTGKELLDSLAANFKPQTTLPYGVARDTLYSKVFMKNDSVSCIYSGHTVYLDPTQDPTQYVYQNGTSNGINAEHGYPQSKGADLEPARSDMHHLYPSRIAVNGARQSFPLAEVPDPSTQKWFYLNNTLTSTPTQNKDLYSESGSTSFEPRESSKGDLARAIFYFYTMYKPEADAADPNFFNLQLTDICNWHTSDPIAADEYQRTWKIAPHQHGKVNPFILDCTLAKRAYCLNAATCTSNTTQPNPDETLVQVYPNPTTASSVSLRFWPVPINPITVTTVNAQGKILNSAVFLPAESITLDLPSSIGNSIVWLQISYLTDQGNYQRVVPVVR